MQKFDSGFEKIEFVVTTAQDPYPQDIKFELLKEKINDETHPFGHGYVVAAEVLGVAPELYSV